MDVRVGLWRRLSAEELMLLNCGVGEDSSESLGPLEIQPVHSEGDQPWDFFGRNDAKAEAPILWPPHAKSWLIGKDSDAGRDWGQEEKGTTEDEMAGWYHGLDGRESEWTPGVGDGQGGLVCCDSGVAESDTSEQLNWTDIHINIHTTTYIYAYIYTHIHAYILCVLYVLLNPTSWKVYFLHLENLGCKYNKVTVCSTVPLPGPFPWILSATCSWIWKVSEDFLLTCLDFLEDSGTQHEIKITWHCWRFCPQIPRNKY